MRWAQGGALVAFALAQPLFDVLERHPTFLAVHSASTVDLWILVGMVQIVLPALAALALGPIARWHGGVELALRAGGVGVGAALTASPPLVRLWPDSSVLPCVLALAVGIAFGALFQAWRTLRLYVAALAVAAPIFALSFLLAQPSGGAPSAEGAATDLPADPAADRLGDGEIDSTPIVVVVFDELPLASLLGADGEIDAERLPNFARLAVESTWYTNTTTPHPSTRTAIPALFTGRVVTEPGSIPTVADHPDNLFTRLGPTHRLAVSGSIRELCPEAWRGSESPRWTRLFALVDDLGIVWTHLICPRVWRESLPAVDDTWIDFRAQDPRERRDAWRARLSESIATRDRAGQARAFAAGLVAGEEPMLHAMHVVLPHAPWIYLPAGTLYSGPRKELSADVALRRYLLQLGFVDRLLGELLDALQRSGLWDDALVIVTADHGASFLSADRRRTPTPERLPDIAHVPLFVRFPGQAEARVDARPASTIDVVPTILDVVGAYRAEWPKLDGRSLARPPVEPPPARRLMRESGGAPLELSSEPLGTSRLGHQIQRLLGARSDVAALFTGEAGRPWVGRTLSSFELAPASAEAAVELEDLGRDELRSGWAVCHVAGRVTGRAPAFCALVVDATVVAVARIVSVEDEHTFSALVPPEFLEDPSARLRVFGLEPGPPARLIALE